MNIAKIQESANLDYVQSMTGLSIEQLEDYPEDAFNLFWFMRANNLTSLTLQDEDVNKLHSCGFFKTAALMNSIKIISMDDIKKLQYNQSPAELALHRVLSLDNCKTTEAGITFGVPDRNAYWFSIQYGIYSITVPSYLWNLAESIIEKVTRGRDFEVRPTFASGVPVLQLAFNQFSFSDTIHEVLEIPLSNDVDPVLRCADDFCALNLYKLKYSVIEKVTVLFQLINLMEIDHRWQLAFTSPLCKQLMFAYDPGDSYLDTLLKLLQDNFKCEIQAQQSPDANGNLHVKDKIVYVKNRKLDLLEYARHPEAPFD